MFTQNVGNVTSVGVTAPVGVFHVRVHAVDASGESLPSNEIDVRVTSLVVPPAPPAAPTDLAAYINGTSALITWSPGQGGGAPTGLVLFAGTTPGASDIGSFPVGLGTQLSVPNLAAGNYYLRVAAANAAGLSPASNEVLLGMPAGGGCSAPPARTFTASAFGRYVQFGWQGVPGAAGYRLDFSAAPGGPVTASLPFGPNQTGYAVTGAPLGVFYGKLVTAFSCGQQTPGPEVALTIDGAPPPGPRTPDPAAGQRLPFRSQDGAIVSQLARERPDLLRDSCREHGGNNRFMFEAVRRLRADRQPLRLELEARRRGRPLPGHRQLQLRLGVRRGYAERLHHRHHRRALRPQSDAEFPGSDRGHPRGGHHRNLDAPALSGGRLPDRFG